jgi:hypothetical protein
VETKAQKSDEQETMTLARRYELLDELIGCVAQAQDGDEEALRHVGKILQEVPDLAQILSDLARDAERAFIERTSGGDPLIKKALLVQLENMRQEVAGTAAPPLERLLAERIVACWLQLHYAELLYVQNLPDFAQEQDEYYQKRLDRLNRRYLSAIRSLAQVRKLLKPSVAQVNIGEKQINMAGHSSEQ